MKCQKCRQCLVVFITFSTCLGVCVRTCVCLVILIATSGVAPALESYVRGVLGDVTSTSLVDPWARGRRNLFRLPGPTQRRGWRGSSSVSLGGDRLYVRFYRNLPTPARKLEGDLVVSLKKKESISHKITFLFHCRSDYNNY